MLSLDGLTMSLYKVQILQDWPEPQKVKDIQSFSVFQFLPLFHLQVFWNHHSTHMSNPQGCSLALSWWVPFCLLKQLKRLSPQLWSLPIDLDTQITVKTDALTTHSPLSFESWLQMVNCTNCTPLPDFFWLWKHNYNVHDKELLTIFEAFKQWQHYLEGSGLLIDVVTNHQNLQYFQQAKILMHHQACWSEYLSGFNLIIHFHPRNLEPNLLDNGNLS